MKYLLFATMLHLALLGSAQTYAEEAKAAREKTNEMLPFEIVYPVGTMDTIIYPTFTRLDVIKDDMARLLQAYVNQLPFYERHETDLIRDIFLEDCDLKQIEGRDGMSVWYEWQCSNPEHVVKVRQKPTFEGFVNWLLNPKQ